MRILCVSSHYPPNWTSGGTLVPHRCAVGLAERGHEVHVFAGWIGEGRIDGERWDEVDEHGISIRWTAITGWTDWAHPGNFENPAITVAFTAHLQELRPDIVHAHSLQGFGAGVITAARSLGIPTVVTMHDLWWFCGRQFLVDPELRPCTVVPQAGCCPCELGEEWRRRRAAALVPHLAQVDLVLAPSQALVDLLVANGLDPRRARVDENAAPAGTQLADPGEVHDPPVDGPVRFVYAGGHHALKGPGVLLEAVRRLEHVPGWTLDLYGFGDDARDALRDDRATAGLLHRLPVRVQPPFPSSAADEVLGAHDVLVLPSLARESYSLLCREALAAGLPVVTSDTPGPMEVVHHGENGLVVPAGDAEALAGALRSLVEDRALLRSLQPKPDTVRLRPVDEQVDGLEALYAELLPRAGRPLVAPSPPVRSVLFVCGIEGAPLRYRARLPAEALALRGIRSEVRYYRSDDLPELAAAAEAIVFYRAPATPQLLQLVADVRRRDPSVPILYDIDDLVFDPDVASEIDPLLAHLPAIDRERYWQGVRRYRTMLEHCDAYIGSTDALCAAVRELVGIPAHRFPNGVGIQLGRVSDHALRRPRRDGPTRIAYFSGTSTHNADWAAVEPAVLEVLRRHPEVELWLGGLLEPGPAVAELGRRLVRMPMRPWWELPDLLRDVDVNLAPLAPGGSFNEAKSAIKWLEAALVGTPTVATPSQPFREAIEHGVTGLLATTHEEWVEQLDRLVGDEATQHRIGQRARQEALLRWSPELQADRYVEILRQAKELRTSAPGERTSSWPDEVLDEPWLPAELEGYGLPPGLLGDGLPRPLGVALAAYYGRARELLRSQGAGAVARKAGSVSKSVPKRLAQRALRSRR
jgi:glycosyltransferase involved in cell wall biosynthesis